jgi:hypothetical protein
LLPAVVLLLFLLEDVVRCINDLRLAHRRLNLFLLLLLLFNRVVFELIFPIVAKVASLITQTTRLRNGVHNNKKRADNAA